MLYILLLVLSVVLTVSKSMVNNLHAKRHSPDTASVFGYNSAAFVAAIPVVFLWDCTVRISLSTFLSACGYAACFLLLQTLSVLAMKNGSMALTATMVLYGMIIPALAGPVFWKEPFGICSVIGMVLMLVSFLFLKQKEETQAVTSSKWWGLVLLCFLFSGGCGLMEKIHQSTPHPEEKTGFLLCAFVMMLIGSLILFAVTKKTGKAEAIKTALPFSIAYGVLLGFCCRVNLTLAGKLPSILYYPVSNGGALCLTLLVSALLFREKPTKAQWIGFAVGLISISVISLPY